MEKTCLRSIALDISCRSISPSTKPPKLNRSLRKYAKPIIFKDNTPDEVVYNNLANNFKLRPYLKISNFIPTNSKVYKKISVTINQTQIVNPPRDVQLLSKTRVLRQRTPTKHRTYNKEKLKPMFRQYMVNESNIEVEGRPCSRNHRYPCLDPKTPDLYHSRNLSYDIALIRVELKNINHST